MNFDIDQAVREWRQALRKHRELEPGFIEELESSLYDRYDEYLIRGYDPETAFAKAKAKVMPDEESLSKEFAKVTGQPARFSFGLRSFLFLLPNYVKVAIRNLRRKQFYNTINFVCLAIGILTTALALLYLDYETSYDEFVPEAEQKYRLGRAFRSQDYSVMSFDGYFSAEPEVQMKQINGIKSVRGVKDACQFYTFGQPAFVSFNENKLPTEDLLHTNTPAAFFDFFGWPFLYGSAEDFSSTLNTAVLTESQAERFFGSGWRKQNLLDKQLIIDELPYSIKGVIEDIPPNSHYTFSIALHRDKIEYWGSRTYIKIAEGVDPDAVRQRIDADIANINTRLAESELFGGTIVQNIRSIHLNSDMLYELKPPGDKRYLYIIGIISGIILLLTVSNYTNLSIAMNAGRAREIGMRKIFGASRAQVSQQFVMESLVLSLLTLPVVGAGLYGLIPYFNNFMGTGLDENITKNYSFWGILLAVTFGVGLLASIYPAIFMARRRILRLFQGNLAKNSLNGFSTRKAIITFQFALLIGLCSLTLFVNQQLRFIQDKDLGFDEDQVVYVNLSEDSTKFEVFKNELLRIPEVTGVGSGSPLGRNPFNQTTYKLKGTEPVFDDAHDIALDYSAVDLLNIETTIPEYVNNPADAPKELVLINETLADKLSTTFNMPREALIGKTIIEEPEYTNEETGQVGFPFTIAGTFQDINMFSLREKIDPMFLTVYKNPGFVRWASVGFQGNPLAVLEKIKQKYRAMDLDRAFVHSFLSQNIEELYEQERRIAKLSIYFSLIAFLVAVIGLVALTAFLTTLKRKEIGIRTILGASDFDILKQFNKEYLWLIAIALLLAAPPAYLGVSDWLSTFAYRISINPGIFLLAGGITLVISSIAVSLMTLRVARSVPAKALQEDQ